VSDDINIGVRVEGEGRAIASQLAKEIAALRKEWEQLNLQLESGRGSAAAKQAADELAASARSIAAARKDATAATRAATQYEREFQKLVDEEQRQAAAQKLAREKQTAAAVREEKRKQLEDERKYAADFRALQKEEAAAERDRIAKQKSDRATLNRYYKQLEKEKLEAQKAADAQLRDEQLASARQISANQKRQIEEERATNRAKNAIAKQQAADARAAVQQQRALTAAQKEAQKEEARRAAEVQKQRDALNDQASAVANLLKYWLLYRAAVAGFNAFKEFTRIGLEFNQTIETANLGIASLITASTKMTDQTGKEVDGLEKLAIARSIAETQVKKLRIAGLQTAATTEQLVVAFQQAVGVGLSWGLTLDQIRIITIQVSQAAGNLGVPLNQLNEELRSLLSGTITPRNTRIATALRITNAQIKEAQKAGTLFDFVTKRLEAFSTAGEESQKTFTGVMSNLRETLQSLGGDATKPLFETLRLQGMKTLQDMFDLKQARIANKFAGILEVATNVFGRMGDLLANGIEAGVTSAARFNVWLRENRVEITRTGGAIESLVAATADLAASLAGIGTLIGDAGTKTSAWADIFHGMGFVVAGIHEILQVIFGLLGTIGLLVVNVVLQPLRLILVGMEKMAELMGKQLPAGFREATDSLSKFLDDTNKGWKIMVENAVHGGLALSDFSNQMHQSDEAAKKRAAGQAVLSKALDDAAQGEFNSLQLLDDALKKHVLTQKDYNDKANAIQLESTNEQIAAQQAYLRALDKSDAGERRRTENIIRELLKRKQALERNVTLTSNENQIPDKKNNSAAFQADILVLKEKMNEELKDLKIKLEEAKISYETYWDGVRKARQAFIDAEIAANKDYLARLGADEADKRNEINEKIKALELERAQIVDDTNAGLIEDNKKLDEEALKSHIQLLKDMGNSAGARALEVDQKFKETIKRLQLRGGQEDQINILNQLYGVDNAKAALADLSKRAQEVQQTLRTNLSRISADLTAGNITEAQSRKQVAVAYSQARSALLAIIPDMERFANATEDQNAIDSVEQLRTAIVEMGIDLRRASDEWRDFKDAGKTASKEAIANFLTQLPEVFSQNTNEIDALRTHLGQAQAELSRLMAGEQTPAVQQRMTELREEIEKVNVELKNSQDELITWKDLFMDSIRSIVAAMQRLVAEMIAALIVQRASNFLGGLFSGGGSVSATHSGGPVGIPDRVPVATGGYIRGPGTGRSDSIPAWLSNGEFVIRAAAVNAVGLDVLHQINAQGSLSSRSRSSIRAGFAEGGLVVAPAGAPGEMNATIGLEEGLVLRHLQTKNGVRAILGIINNNSRSISAVLDQG
jgi:hypothetical protein